ncbi:MAG: hypothetical protein JHC26_11880 [Thermofilum sp.]|jgi:hypothetical protein|uniref:hypothetical protein n=1 Tax=Thermofilum sp. TaxID=1961369 RepID=UPI00258D6CE9|nr:hypothetical protein [Thermofilum sp.]MCI4409783.1 hypothetical protein [Thermofilum sp.]
MPRRKYKEIEKDGKKMRVSIQKLRVDNIKLPSGQPGKRYFMTIPRPYGELLEKNGVVLLQVMWDEDNPWQFIVIPLKTEEVTPEQQQQKTQQ